MSESGVVVVTGATGREGGAVRHGIGAAGMAERQRGVGSRHVEAVEFGPPPVVACNTPPLDTETATAGTAVTSRCPGPRSDTIGRQARAPMSLYTAGPTVSGSGRFAAVP